MIILVCLFFQQEKKIKRKQMGTACICFKQRKQPYNFKPLDPALLDIENERGSMNNRECKNRFMDIRNQYMDESMLSQLNLNNMTRQLSRYLIEFQTKNGIITHRFTQRIVQQSQNELALALIDDNFQKNKENVAEHLKQNELYLPLNNQNCDSDIEQSMNSDMEPEQTNNKSCLLSLSSRILNQSLFTDRERIKKQFYGKYNMLGETTLKEWSNNHRLSYEYEQADIYKLKEKYLDSKFIAGLNCIFIYWQTHFIHLLTYCKYPNGFKLYLNGDMKMVPLPQHLSTDISLIQLYEGVIEKVKHLDVADLIYVLTGWMPQHIYLSQIKNFAGILERLGTNLIQGNTLVSFTRQTKLGKEYATLVRIDFQNGLIYLNSHNQRNTIPDILLQHKNELRNQIAVKLQSFVELFDVINLNWNPYIYDLSQTCQGIIDKNNQDKKFLLVIPSSSQDLQIRLFFQRHQDFMNPTKVNIVINLYEYNGTSEIGEAEPIRTIETNQAIYSDVFIFQYCKEKTQYLLTVEIKGQQMMKQDVYFTLTLYSFAEMKFKQLEAKPCLKKIGLSAKITGENVGYGINSPYFNKNLQFSVETEVGGQLQIKIDASNKLNYQICLIPDPMKQRNLTKLKLENIINNSQISSEKKGKGSFFIKTSFSHYLLMINAYSSTQQSVNIDLILYGKKQNTDKNVSLKIQQIFQAYNALYLHDLKWLPTHSGPRKRLKSNSTSQFQPTQVFSQFFKNPLIDKKLIKGTYQFFIKSETFRDYFDSVQSYEDKNSCEPPALSMAIFLTSEDKQSYKIILDDAFYVPFGVGFWTTSIELQQGTYRFVLPKMDKGFSKGIFGIIKN